jgi:NAD(P)-dependent dehydrogenase (short-subunit alcohol dehydrogenase family)
MSRKHRPLGEGDAWGCRTTTACAIGGAFAGDIGQTAVFLAAPASDYINGAIINVDGGRFARQAVP